MYLHSRLLHMVKPQPPTSLNRLRLSQQHISPSITASRSLCNNSISVGTKYTQDFKNYASVNNKVVSYFHDIPLDLDMQTKTANMIVEIPRWTNGKFEINTKLPGNPITQDVKKGKVRFVKNLFPHHGYIHNYGAFPQTWEDPTSKNEQVGGLYGDNDPLDVCEIGQNVAYLGQIKRVKILGSLALIDDGELDWKIIVIDINDPLAEQLNDIQDVYSKCPGYLEATVQWFRDYKKPDGKPANNFAFDGQYQNQQITLQVIQECSDAWKKLIQAQTTGDSLPSIVNTTFPKTPGYVESYDLQLTSHSNEAQVPKEAQIPKEVDKSYFI